MKKIFSSKLTVKLFVLVCSVLIGVSLLICGLFALIMPQSFVREQNESFEEDLTALIETFSDEGTALAALESFALENGVLMELIAQGETVGTMFGNFTIFQSDVSVSMNVAEGESQVVTYAEEQSDVLTIAHELVIGDARYTLIIHGISTREEDAFSVALRETLPVILVVSVLVSFIVAMYLSRFITRPIARINATARDMAKLSFDVHLPEQRNDELGELSRSINHLSQSLDHALSSLKDELARTKAMEEASRLFFGAASHELKTPLTVIKGNLEGMVYGYQAYQDKEAVIARTLRTTAQILAVSALGADDVAMKREHFSLRILMEDLLAECADIAEMRNITVEENLSETEAFADKALLQKALQNILSNALHHSPEGETVCVMLEGGKLTVRNTGVHINKTDIEKVFEPFYRIDRSRSRETGGSGLGLYFVKTILEKHGFAYSIMSEGNAVCFEISIP